MLERASPDLDQGRCNSRFAAARAAVAAIALIFGAGLVPKSADLFPQPLTD